jgi:crotonobetainyl-CoA:carnitine CoA-transferase CaiB-like acyl-CoA transferase
MLDHPQVQANDLVVHREHPAAGTLRQARAPARFSGQSEQPWRSAPGLGRDTGDLLAECGYSERAIQHMIDTGVAGAGG